MFTRTPVLRFRATLVSAIVTKNKGTVTDPVQQLFIDKIKEYRSKSTQGIFVEPNEAILTEYKKEMEKLEKAYGGDKGIDMNAFPEFKFQDPNLDPIDTTAPAKPKK